MNPKISIVIPVFNVEDTLERCVTSFINQTYKNLEIVLVDDGSTDTSGEICKSLAKNDNRIKYIFQKNRGLPSARNTGMKKVTGDYILFLDSDDTIDNDVVELLVKNLKKDTLVGCNVKSIFPKKSVELNRKGDFEKDAFLEELFDGKKPAFVCGYLFDAGKCRAVSFDEKTRYYEDILFLVKYLKGVKKVKLLPDCFYNYYQNPKSITLSSADTSRKLSDIVSATEKTNKETDGKFVEKNNNREISLFEAILQRVDEKTLKDTVEKYKLPIYTGTSKRLKLFSKLYSSKNIKGLKRYYRLRKIGKSIALKFM